MVLTVTFVNNVLSENVPQQEIDLLKEYDDLVSHPQGVAHFLGKSYHFGTSAKVKK